MAVMTSERRNLLEVGQHCGRILRLRRQRSRQSRGEFTGADRWIDRHLRLVLEVSERPVQRGAAKALPLAGREIETGLSHGFAAKCAITASAVLAPTTRASSSRVARRTPARLPKAVNNVFRRLRPMPGTTSSSDCRSRLWRDWRW